MSKLKDFWDKELEEEVLNPDDEGLEMALEYLRYHSGKSREGSYTRQLIDGIIEDLEDDEHRKDLYRGS